MRYEKPEVKDFGSITDHTYRGHSDHVEFCKEFPWLCDFNGGSPVVNTH